MLCGEKCQFINPGDILLYDNVAIGENCYIEAGKNISIGHDTIIEAEAYICGSGMAVQDGVPVLGNDWQTRYDGQVMIGHHSHLERKVTVLGNVEIGCGCLIKANSTVYDDIPPHCVAAGNPARVIKALDYEDGKWLVINGNAELHDLLEKRKMTQPILTIGIPTYNRSYYLDKCLQAIYRQLGNIFIKQYFDILASFRSRDDTPGLSEDCIRSDKKNVMEKFFLPWCKVVTSSDSVWKIDEDIFDILQAYYGDEAYYTEIKALIKHYSDMQGIDI